MGPLYPGALFFQRLQFRPSALDFIPQRLDRPFLLKQSLTPSPRNHSTRIDHLPFQGHHEAGDRAMLPEMERGIEVTDYERPAEQVIGHPLVAGSRGDQVGGRSEDPLALALREGHSFPAAGEPGDQDPPAGRALLELGDRQSDRLRALDNNAPEPVFKYGLDRSLELSRYVDEIRHHAVGAVDALIGQGRATPGGFLSGPKPLVKRAKRGEFPLFPDPGLSKPGELDVELAQMLLGPLHVSGEFFPLLFCGLKCLLFSFSQPFRLQEPCANLFAGLVNLRGLFYSLLASSLQRLLPQLQVIERVLLFGQARSDLKEFVTSSFDLLGPSSNLLVEPVRALRDLSQDPQVSFEGLLQLGLLFLDPVLLGFEFFPHFGELLEFRRNPADFLLPGGGLRAQKLDTRLQPLNLAVFLKKPLAEGIDLSGLPGEVEFDLFILPLDQSKGAAHRLKGVLLFLLKPREPRFLRLECLPIGGGNFQIEVLYLLRQLAVAFRLSGLPVEGVHLPPDLPDNVPHARQILLGGLQFSQSLGLSKPVLRDSSGLLNQFAPLHRRGIEDRIDLSLLDHRMGVVADPGIDEKLPDVFEATRGLIDQIFTLSRAEEPSGHREFPICRKRSL